MKKQKGKTPKERRRQLAERLKKDAAGGIKVNKKQNTINMCSQMSNVDLWVKELAANSSDAGASRFRVYGFETETHLTIICEDNGHGMDKEGITNYFTIYRSRKTADVQAKRAIHGTHGVGKLSVAKIPDQSGYKLTTSTGAETWEATTGSIIKCDPIEIKSQKKVLPQGTRIEVTFKKTGTLYAYMKRMHNVLKEYTRYLGMEIIVHMPAGGDEPENYLVGINDNWKPEYDPATISEHYTYGVNDFAIVLGIGSGGQEIYQSRILITDQYNLISYDLPKSWPISNLWIRVDSPHFKLPFGRHKLMNEEILIPLSRHIREHLLPRLIRQIADSYPDSIEKNYGIRIEEFESLLLNLMFYDSEIYHPWFNVPVFKMVIGNSLSLNQLFDLYDEKEIILLEDGEFDGVDFALFDMPVLAKDQPDMAMKILNESFSKNLYRIGENDLVFEPKKGEGPELGKDELRFQDALGIDEDAFGYGSGYGTSNFISHMSHTQYAGIQRLMPTTSIDESMRALDDLREIRWRVNYLMDRDGTTPNYTHMFIFRDNEIILNLYHNEIKNLLELSKKTPALAGHWATALCLGDKRNVLPHLSAETREDLLTLDAMIRAGEMGVEESESESTDPPFTERRRRFRSGFGDFFSLN